MRNAPGTNELGPADVLELYRTILVIRHAEERLSTLFSEGEVPGFIHLSIGQEAVSAGIMSALERADTIASTHRGHGHAIAKGLPLPGFFAELLARDSGLCRGRGGSMHVADMSAGMLGANGIVGAGLPIALGSALAHRRLGRNNVAVAFFGDGALAEGVLHETFNMAALWHLPILFVCENNGWSEFSATETQLSFKLKDLAKAYGIPHASIEGNDVVAVAVAARKAVAEIRAGGPRILECITTRFKGHFEGDPQKYRETEELEALSARDPVKLAAERLTAMGVSAKEIEGVAVAALRDVNAAVDSARAGPPPSFDAALIDVYTRQDAPAHG